MKILHTINKKPYYEIVADKLMNKSLTKQEIIDIITDYAAGAILDSELQREIYEKTLS